MCGAGIAGSVSGHYGGRLGVLPEHYLKGPGGDPPPYDLDYGFDLAKEDEEEEDDGDDEL